MNTNLLLSHRKQEPERGVLYIVGTPIGNLDDISLRATNILKNVSLIACEDTRTTHKLLNYLKISNKVISFHKYNSRERLDYIISKLTNGDSIALVSDAGMPLISDPGEILVKTLREKDFDVICVPGPCAALTALVCSGLATSQFTFYGFIPKSTKEREKILKEIYKNSFTSLVYESPKRIMRLLLDLKNICGSNRKMILLKELTKRYEKHYGNNIETVIQKIQEIEPRGEFTLVISGNKDLNKEMNISERILKDDLINLIKAGLSHSAASSYLSKKFGKHKKEIYKLILDNELKY